MVMYVGKLKLAPNGRWSIVDDEAAMEFDLGCGDTFQVFVGGHWIETGLEHNANYYYATTRGLLLMKNLPARKFL